MLDNLKIWLSRIFRLPVSRRAILRRVVKLYKGKTDGLREALEWSLIDYGIYLLAADVFSEFLTRENAKGFGGTLPGFWWPKKDWTSGRSEFLDWLIEQYKDDKTNLRNYVQK